MANPVTGAVISAGKGLFSILGRIFSGLTEPAAMMFKQHIASKILGWFGLDASHGLAKYIAIALGQVPVLQLPKLFTDCKFLVSILGKALPHFIAQSVDIGTGVIGTYAKTALSNVFNDVKFVETLTDNLANSVCAKLGQAGSTVAKKGEGFIQQLNAASGQAAAPAQAQAPAAPQALPAMAGQGANQVAGQA
jgi:hypothetical protein